LTCTSIRLIDAQVLVADDLAACSGKKVKCES
jgi:hypothetical protein